ncbi:MAG: hypothetical protein K6T86_11315 [Pirellulales bacterium]|jgi:hypothetical protein|nr:hypothetical protein [Pirellulales bacterium]
MRFFRALFSLAFWVLALGAAAPGVIRLQPFLGQLRDAWQHKGNWPSLTETQWVVDLASGTVPWLLLAGVFAANATLLRLVNSTERL